MASKQPGNTRNKGGRPKGSPNKSTALAREAIAKFVDGNAERLQGWLDQIAAESPKDAFNAFLALAEYHVPKLARVEHTGEGGGDIRFVVTQGHVRGL